MDVYLSLCGQLNSIDTKRLCLGVVILTILCELWSELRTLLLCSFPTFKIRPRDFCKKGIVLTHLPKKYIGTLGDDRHPDTG